MIIINMIILILCRHISLEITQFTKQLRRVIRVYVSWKVNDFIFLLTNAAPSTSVVPWNFESCFAFTEIASWDIHAFVLTATVLIFTFIDICIGCKRVL